MIKLIVQRLLPQIKKVYKNWDWQILKGNSKKQKSDAKQINLESDDDEVKISEEPANKKRASKKATQTKQKKRKMEEEGEPDEDDIEEEENNDDEDKPRKVIYLAYDDKQRQQFEKNVTDLQKNNVNQLKEKLKRNDYSCTGTKKELIEKVADGMVLGAIPRCHHCGGGRLKFNNKAGQYHCPGYMEDTDFVHCNKKFTMSEIERGKWED